MSTKTYSIPNAPAPIGPYSQAVEKNGTLFISGQIPLNPISGELILTSIAAQTRQVMENLGALLKAADLTFQDVQKCSIFLTNLGHFETVNDVYSEYFQAPFPARECVEISALPKGVDVEISCIAIRDVSA